MKNTIKKIVITQNENIKKFLISEGIASESTIKIFSSFDISVEEIIGNDVIIVGEFIPIRIASLANSITVLYFNNEKFMNAVLDTKADLEDIKEAFRYSEKYYFSKRSLL